MRRIALAALAALLLAVACGGSSPSTDGSADQAPEFTVGTFAGSTFSLREQRGTPVVLNFWESW
jgi:ABC-type glycerol-3-phosphate transport system substrate-binding protein